MFDYLKKRAITNREDDEILYEYVLNEIENGNMSKGLWGKALANSNGDDKSAKSIYLKYRVQSIKDDFTSMEIAYNELTKSKIYQLIEESILPKKHDYNTLSNDSKVLKSENYSVNEDEERLYEKIADELSNNIRKEGLWLKAIQNTNGNEEKALALYIKYRSESIKLDEIKEQERILEENKNKLLEEQKTYQLTNKYFL